MKGVNNVILVGNVGVDPTIRSTSTGTSVATFTLATTGKWKNKDDEWEERTEWHNLVCWKGLADIVEKYIEKGARLYVEGSLKTESWEDQDSGVKKYRTTVVVKDMVMLSPSGNGTTKPDNDGFDQRRETNSKSNQKQVAAGKGKTGNTRTATGTTEITDDDIPF